MVVPQRTCIGCGQVKAKKDLIRIVRLPVGRQESRKTGKPEGQEAGSSSLESSVLSLEFIVTVDLRGKEKGRGAYICPNIDCINRAMQPERLNKAFRINPSRVAERGDLGNSSDRISLETIDKLKQSLLGLIEAHH